MTSLLLGCGRRCLVTEVKRFTLKNEQIVCKANSKLPRNGLHPSLSRQTIPFSCFATRPIETYQPQLTYHGYGEVCYHFTTSSAIENSLKLCTLKTPIHFQPCCGLHTSAILKFQAKRSSERKDSRDYGTSGTYFKDLMILLSFGGIICLVVLCIQYVSGIQEKNIRPRTRQEQSEELLKEFKKPGSNKIRLSLQIAECELYIGRGREEEALQRVRDVVLTAFNLLEIVKSARTLAQNGAYVRALILYHIIHVPVKAFEKMNIPTREILKWTSDRITDVGMAVRPLIKSNPASRDLAIKYGLRYMEKLLADVRSVESADKDFKALNEACCLHNIAFINIELGKHKTATSVAKEGLACLEKQFGKTETGTIYHGALFNDMGLIHEQLGEWSDAENYYNSALESYDKVNDGDESRIQEHIAITKERLEAVRKHLRD